MERIISTTWLVLAIFFLFAFLATPRIRVSAGKDHSEGRLKTAVYYSPAFVLGPGSVENRFYDDVDFPRGHIALKSFTAEVVDEAGNPVPLHETYLHHWVVVNYYESVEESANKTYIRAGNSGNCKYLSQYFGLGSETRGTATWIPDPYGIEVGNPDKAPRGGYQEKWLVNVHAIDTRGADDTLGCAECRCSLYNVTVDEYGRPIQEDYFGGLLCCNDHTQCRARKEAVRRKLYLKYTVKWVDWDDSIVPVKIYIFDVTTYDNNKKKKKNMSSSSSSDHDLEKRDDDDQYSCRVEYNVEACGPEAGSAAGGRAKCIDNKRTQFVMPNGGDIVYGVAHQHSGGAGAALYGEDGRLLCSSIPTYGNGKEAGNEAGYIVGMSTCYPKPGSVRIADGEILTLESNYSSSQMHTGVMGLFYIYVADTPQQNMSDAPPTIQDGLMQYKYAWIVLLLCVAAVALAVYYRRGKEGERGYQSLVVPQTH